MSFREAFKSYWLGFAYYSVIIIAAFIVEVWGLWSLPLLAKIVHALIWISVFIFVCRSDIADIAASIRNNDMESTALNIWSFLFNWHCISWGSFAGFVFCGFFKPIFELPIGMFLGAMLILSFIILWIVAAWTGKGDATRDDGFNWALFISCFFR